MTATLLQLKRRILSYQEILKKRKIEAVSLNSKIILAPLSIAMRLSFAENLLKMKIPVVVKKIHPRSKSCWNLTPQVISKVFIDSISISKHRNKENNAFMN